MWSITGNAALLKKTYVPKYIFTLSKVTSSCVNTLFSLGAMLIVFVVCKVPFNRYMLFIPVIILQLYIFCVGMGMFLSQATVFFRDIQYIYAAFITAWMYLTPIFYPINQLPFELMWGIKHFNPMYSYITQFRTIVLEQSMPDPRLVIYGFAVSFVILIVGTVSFIKHFNPMYSYITQFRTIVLEQSMPDPRLVIYGFAVSFVILIVGTVSFMKNQDRFILYI